MPALFILNYDIKEWRYDKKQERTGSNLLQPDINLQLQPDVSLHDGKAWAKLNLQQSHWK